MSTPGYEPTSRNDDALRAGVEKASGGPLQRVEFRRKSEVRTCVACPEDNPDCEHPTCPRWPQPGHFATKAAEIVDYWRMGRETGAKGYADLEWHIAKALAKAARQ